MITWVISTVFNKGILHQFNSIFSKGDMISITSDENVNNQPNYNWILHNINGLVQDCSNSSALAVFH